MQSEQIAPAGQAEERPPVLMTCGDQEKVECQLVPSHKAVRKNSRNSMNFQRVFFNFAGERDDTAKTLGLALEKRP